MVVTIIVNSHDNTYKSPQLWEISMWEGICRLLGEGSGGAYESFWYDLPYLLFFTKSLVCLCTENSTRCSAVKEIFIKHQ